MAKFEEGHPRYGGRKRALSNLSVKQEVGRPSGLHSRLESHASGKRSGDEFCDFVADQILAAAGHSVSDDFVRDYVCQHLSYRYFAFEGLTEEDQQRAYRLERRIQAGNIPLAKPLLNPPNPQIKPGQ
jgi:hypothetical protein